MELAFERIATITYGCAVGTNAGRMSVWDEFRCGSVGSAQLSQHRSELFAALRDRLPAALATRWDRRADLALPK